MKFEAYRDERGEWRWRLWSVNGRKIATSGEGYKNYIDCINAINLVKSTNGFTPVVIS